MFSVKHRLAVINWRFCLTRPVFRPRACKRLLANSISAKRPSFCRRKILRTRVGYGIGPSALDGFVTLLATSKDKLEETFQNIEIRQDGDLGLVTMNYDFVINDKIHHSGLEHWQVRKIDGQWKILSVTWTKYSQIGRAHV